MRALLVLALAGCSLNVDYQGTFYQCGSGGQCPSGYACVDQQCVPAEPPPPACSTALASGGDHSCSIRSDGTAWCWGRNDFGQLGDNSTTDRTAPVQVAGLARAKQIVAGSEFTCALDAAGAVWCWGHNDSGQLGDGTMADAKMPVQVKNLTGVTQIAAGQGHACALLGDGSVQCWGYDDDGQLGDGSGVPSRNLAAAVSGLPKIAAIAAGHDESCAIDTGGALYCWGDNNDGQLGVGDTTSRDQPVQVKALSQVAGVAIGTYFACAYTTAGTVSCTGDDDDGQLGDGNAGSNRHLTTPVVTQVPTKVVALTAGEGHACAVDDANRLWCWGNNGSGQLAEGTTSRSLLPVRALFDDVSIAAAGANHTCVLGTAGGIQCMGDDGRGQLGDARRTTEGAPQAVPGLTGVTAISAGGDSTCALHGDGSVACWGANGDGQLGDGTETDRAVPTTVPGATAIASLAQGRDHTCALGRDGSVVCWGADYAGQLGDGSTQQVRPTPYGTVALSGPATALAAGSRHTCAVVDGAVSCWGDNRHGGLGAGSTAAFEATPIAVPGESGVTAIAAGGSHTCVAAAGAVSCWGHDDHGQLGDNMGTYQQATMPVTAAGVSAAVELAARNAGTCAREMDGSVWCWGRGDGGRVGDGNSSRDNPKPVQVVNVSGASQLAVGAAMSCALVAGGAVWCWGSNSAGQVGDGTYQDRSTAVQVAGLTGVTAIAAGNDHVCAVEGDGTVACWGDDSQGQLGDGIATPVVPANTQMTCP